MPLKQLAIMLRMNVVKRTEILWHWYKKETGKTAIEHTQNNLLDVAKINFDSNKAVIEIAYEPGIKYPQLFAGF